MALAANIRRRPGRPSGDTDLRPVILDAAEAAFAAAGFGAASVRQIAAQAGVSPAAVLHHFSSKGDLYHAVLVRIGESLQAESQLFDLNKHGGCWVFAEPIAYLAIEQSIEFDSNDLGVHTVTEITATKLFQHRVCQVAETRAVQFGGVVINRLQAQHSTQVEAVRAS